MRFLAALLLALALAAPAVADEASDQARASFQKGQTEYNLGNYADAAKHFEETYRLKPVPALLFNIAQCYRFIGNLEKAVQTYRAYLRTAPAGDRNIALAKELLGQVETALASRNKAESSAPHGLAAAPPVTGPATTPPAPASAAPAPAEKTPEKPAVQVAVAAAPAPEPRKAAAPAEAVSASAPPPARTRLYTWVAAGASAVALVGGAVFGLKSKSTLSSLQTGYHTRAELDAQSASAKSDAGKANAMLAAGAALAVVSGVFFAFEF